MCILKYQSPSLKECREYLAEQLKIVATNIKIKINFFIYFIKFDYQSYYQHSIPTHLTDTKNLNIQQKYSHSLSTSNLRDLKKFQFSSVTLIIIHLFNYRYCGKFNNKNLTIKIKSQKIIQKTEFCIFLPSHPYLISLLAEI